MTARPGSPREPRDLVLEAYDLQAGTEVTAHTLAPGYAVDSGIPLVTSRSVIGTIVDATLNVLVLEAGHTRHRIPWTAVADITTTTEPGHPGTT